MPFPRYLLFSRPALALSAAALLAPALQAQQLPETDPDLPQDEATLELKEIERRGAVIGAIGVTVHNVFDMDDPEESKSLYRWANKVHMTTREGVVEDILLFRPGDRFDARLLQESARLLRSRDFIVEASVVPTAYHPKTNTVDIGVEVRDAWSLSPDFKLGRNGGENEFGIGIEDSNLLGTGKNLTVSYSTDVDRDETYFGYSDGNLRGSRVRLDAVRANNSDGNRTGLSAGRPFYSIDTRWSLSGSVLDYERIDSIYDLGETVDEFVHETRSASLEGGWSQGLVGRRAKRWLFGLNYVEETFRFAPDTPQPMLLPPDRKLVYPWVGFQLVEDDFRVMTELNDIGRTEDISLGLNLKASIGFASESFGSDRDATLLELIAQKGWEPGGPGRLLLFEAFGAARHEDGRAVNSLVSANARYYHRNLGRHLFTASLTGMSTHRLDPEKQVLLGGDSGLRGYPLRYQSGDHSAVLALEQRFYTDWYPLRLFRVAYAVFFDAGRVWGEDLRGTPSLGTLYDVGVGLRLSSPRSSGRSIVHIDLAFPVGADESIDDVQLVVETKRSF